MSADVTGTIIGVGQTAQALAGFATANIETKMAAVVPGAGVLLGGAGALYNGSNIIKAHENNMPIAQADVAGVVNNAASVLASGLGVAVLILPATAFVPQIIIGLTVVSIGAGAYQFVASAKGWTIGSDNSLTPVTLSPSELAQGNILARQLSTDQSLLNSSFDSIGMFRPDGINSFWVPQYDALGNITGSKAMVPTSETFENGQRVYTFKDSDGNITTLKENPNEPVRSSWTSPQNSNGDAMVMAFALDSTKIAYGKDTDIQISDNQATVTKDAIKTTEHYNPSDLSWTTTETNSQDQTIATEKLNHDGSWTRTEFGANGVITKTTDVAADGSYTDSFYTGGVLDHQTAVIINPIDNSWTETYTKNNATITIRYDNDDNITGQTCSNSTIQSLLDSGYTFNDGVLSASNGSIDFAIDVFIQPVAGFAYNADTKTIVAATGSTSIESLLAAEDVLTKANNGGQLPDSIYNGLFCGTISDLLINNNLTIFQPSPDIFYLDPIGAFYDSQSSTYDNAAGIAAQTPVLLNSANQPLTAAQLAALDSNHDGLLSQNESSTAGLKFWRDQNENGAADSGEIGAVDRVIKQNDYTFYTSGNGRLDTGVPNQPASTVVSQPGRSVEVSFSQPGRASEINAGKPGQLGAAPASNYRNLRDTDNVYVGTSGNYVIWAANQVKINYNNKSYLIGTDGNDSFDANYYSGSTGYPYYLNLNLLTNFLAGGGDDTMGGSDRADNLWGGTGNDVLYGYGGAGNDELLPAYADSYGYEIRRRA